MLDIAQRYTDDEGGDREQAMRTFTADLMRGDAATFKAGYTAANAVISTAEAFEATDAEVDELCDEYVLFADRDTVKACVEKDRQGVT